MLLPGVDVEPDADHRPSVSGPGLDQDAGDLPAAHEDVVRPFDLALHRRDALTRLADRDGCCEGEIGRRPRRTGFARAMEKRKREATAPRGNPGPPRTPRTAG